MSEHLQADRETVSQQPGTGLVHTCAEHPRMSDGPHHPGCVALCGFVSKTGSGNTPHVRDRDSCVVCDAMFDALYRTP